MESLKKAIKSNITARFFDEEMTTSLKE